LTPFVETTQQNLTGAVTLSLYKGNVNVVSRKSDYSLYRTDLSSFTMGASYDQKDAEGFMPHSGAAFALPGTVWDCPEMRTRVAGRQARGRSCGS
jgi:argininosuccinate synthase